MPNFFANVDSMDMPFFAPAQPSPLDPYALHPGDAIRDQFRPDPNPLPDFRAMSAVAPGRPEPWGRGQPLAPAGSARAFSPFDLSDLAACYPMPDWVRRRIEDFPQAPDGNALYDPLPVPFTAEEIRTAILDVWTKHRAMRDRGVCAAIDPANYSITRLVERVLKTRNGGWIRIAGRSDSASLDCMLNRLAGKPLPAIYDGACLEMPPREERVYDMARVQTTHQTPITDSSVPGLSSSFGTPASEPDGRARNTAPPWPASATLPLEGPTAAGVQLVEGSTGQGWIPRGPLVDAFRARTGAQDTRDSVDAYDRSGFDVTQTFTIKESRGRPANGRECGCKR